MLYLFPIFIFVYMAGSDSRLLKEAGNLVVRLVPRANWEVEPPLFAATAQ